LDRPTSVDDWTYELLESLVNRGYLETDYYDFKAEINSKDPKHNKNLTKTACAFANTRGGFIVFGVGDLRKENLGIRLKGIKPSSALAKEFGDKIRGASPNIHFEFSNPPIPHKRSDKVFFVVHIPKSSEGPHVTDGGLFYYRTNEGNKLMSYQGIKEGFLRYEERRHKMKLLYVELLSISTDANATIIVPARRSMDYSMVTLEASSLTSLLTDVYSMIQDDSKLVQDLLEIRRIVSVINNQIRAFFSSIILPTTNQAGKIHSHNQALDTRVNILLPLINRVLRKLESRYGLKNPFVANSTK